MSLFAVDTDSREASFYADRFLTSAVLSLLFLCWVTLLLSVVVPCLSTEFLLHVCFLCEDVPRVPDLAGKELSRLVVPDLHLHPDRLALDALTFLYRPRGSRAKFVSVAARPILRLKFSLPAKLPLDDDIGLVAMGFHGIRFCAKPVAFCALDTLSTGRPDVFGFLSALVLRGPH